MSPLSKLLRAAMVLALVFGPRLAEAQKALVYCPVSIDATGCATVKTALTAAYPGGIDTGFDGTQGTVDLKTVDLFQYSVVVIPSLADDSTAPYALLRDAAVASKLKAALLGRRAFWSGTPDQGVVSATRPQKDALIQNLAAWASGDFATVNAPGLVVLQDNSTDVTKRYDWVQAIVGFTLVADTRLASYSAVSSLTAAGNAVLSSNGSTLAYTNMASMGFQTPSGAPGTSLDAVGKTGTGVGGQVVLITQSGANTGGAVVTTDADDYAPGSPVVITGTGFGAGETVTLLLHEDPTIEPDFSFTTTADQNGGFVFSGFRPDSLDVDVRFILRATGQTSGRVAQTTFTDAAGDVNVKMATAGATFSLTWSVYNNATCSGSPASTGTVTVGSAGNNDFSKSVPNPGSIKLQAGTASNGGTFSSWGFSSGTLAPSSSANPVCQPRDNNTINILANYQTTAATSLSVAAASGPFGGTTSLSATLTTGGSPGTGVASKTITFKVDGTAVCGVASLPACPTTNASGVATLSGVSLSGLSVGSHAIAASFAGDASFLASSGTASLSVSTATAVVTIVPASLSATYDGSAHPVTVTTAPSGLAVVVTYAGNSTAPSNAGSYAVVAKLTDPNYTATDATGTLDIARVTPAFSNLSVPAIAYQAPTATISGTVKAGSLAATGSVGITVSGTGAPITGSASVDASGNFTATVNTATLPANVTGYAVALVLPQSTNFEQASDNSQKLIVNKAAQSITFGPLGAKTFGDAPFGVSATSSSGLAVTFSAVGDCTVLGTTVTITGAGNCTVNADQAGDGNYQPAAQVSQPFTINKADPTITWSDPADIVYGTKLSGTQLNASTNSDGALTYTPPSGTLLGAGNAQTLSVSSAATTNYNAATKTVKINVSKADQTISWSDPTAITYGTALSASELNAVVTGVTGGSAIGAVTYSPALGTVLNAGTHALTVNVAGTTDYNPATKTVSLVVNKATPVVTWNAPANITYGTALSSTQLDATANVPGAFLYSPAAGTLLNAGAAQTLSVAFTPTDAANYNSVPQTTTTITVLKADPTITWSNPAGIVYGTALSSTQLNADVQGVAGGTAVGAVTYSPAAGVLLDAGTQTLQVDVASTNNYNAASKIVSIVVAKADQTITWSDPADIVYGTLLSGTQLNAVVSGVTGGTPIGAVTYTPAAGAMLSAGAGQDLKVDVAATSNYNAATKSVKINVTKAPQVITWANPAAITYPTALSSTQLNATVAGVTNGSATGALTYTPASGAVLNAGTQSLKVDVAGTSDYLPATKTVSLVVNKGTPVLTWATPADIPQGTALSATQLNASADVPGSFAYNPAAGTVLLYGPNQLGTLFTPTDAANYNTASASVSINVTNVAPSALTLALPLPTEVTKPLTITGSFTDPGGQSDQHTVNFAWYSGTTLTSISSGTPSITYSGSTGSFSLTRSDIPTGVYWVQVTVTDREGASISANGSYVVVYDPNGGFVTGGGWIVADAGSCIAANAPSGVCTSATGGRANFGFISKYQKGATAPTGNTEFQFQAGNLNFKSSIYQWLVISGGKAQYKGQGTINGGSTQYNFLLTGVDGGAAGGQGVDKFRIKITDANSNVVFDNQMGGDETTGTGSALGGGSINIQSK